MTGNSIIQTRAGGIDPVLWPDVAVVSGSKGRAAIARLLFMRAAGRLPLRVRFPNGEVVGNGGPGSPVMELRRPQAFFRRLGARGLIGFGEAYMADDWAAADLTGLLTAFASQVAGLLPLWAQRLRRIALHAQPTADEPTVDGARQNIHRHYDLSNDLFALFLDETMTYSGALFETDAAGRPLAGDGLLARAQQRKIDALLDRAGVRSGTRLLEVGTGWGELALRAAARGASVLTITISPEQLELTARRIARAGLSDRIRAELRDYRHIVGEFDAICSCEMIEAVGDKYWPDYFRTLSQALAPGGRIGLQAITMSHERMLATRHAYTWINKYIFPGGLIPSVTAIEDNARRAGLRVSDRQDFGLHYEQTLRIWREQFTAHQAEVRRLGFDETFGSMWTFYLSYAEAGFRSGHLDVSQFTLAAAQ
jgi:cyclopropane-fatty-acyl-phospholipid synthase